MSHIQWGDTATWVGSLFLAAAFVGTILLFRLEHGRDKIAEEERSASRMKLQMEQASKISAWYDPSAYKYAEGASPGFPWICIMNSSNDAVYDCHIELRVGDVVF